MQNKRQHTELEKAASNGNLEEVKKLQEKAQDTLLLIKILNNFRKTDQYSRISATFTERAIEDFNAKGDEQTRALILAASAGHIEVVRELLKYDVIEKRHTTAWGWCGEGVSISENIHAALTCAIENNHIEVVTELLAHGAVVTPKVFSGVIVENKVEMVRLLLKHDPTLANQKNPTASYKLPLVRAVDFGNVMIVRELLNHGARINEKEEQCSQPTPLMVAAKHDWNSPKDGIDSVAVAQELLDRGAEVNAQNCHDETALMFAAQHNRLAIARALLERHARVDMVDKLGNTALTNAQKNGHTEMVNILSAALAEAKAAESKESPDPSQSLPSTTRESLASKSSEESTETEKVDRKRKAYFDTTHAKKKATEAPLLQENEHSFDHSFKW